MQAKRIQVADVDGAAGTQIDVAIGPPTTPREEVNYHNIWGSLMIEPTTQDANSVGTWVLWVAPENFPIPFFTDAVINLEETNAKIIACGVWAASNQAPFNMVVNPKTSRNLNAGDTLVLSAHVIGITAGTNLRRAMLCAHVTRK